MTTQQAALDYLHLGYSVIPILPGDKRPAIPWEAFQNKRATEGEIESWWFLWPDANVGIVTGRISSLTVVDVDGDIGLGSVRSLPVALPKTRVIKTPHGHHLYYSYTPELHTGAGFLPGLDVRNDGGQVVAPPSIFDGKSYELFRDNPIVDMGGATRYIIRGAQASPLENPLGDSPDWVSSLLANGVGAGQRDVSATRLAGYFHHKGLPEDIILGILLPWAAKCTPPFSERDLMVKIKSVGKYAVSKAVDISVEGMIRGWVKEAKGWWTTDELDRELGFVTPADRQYRSGILASMRTEGLIENHVGANKQFRTVERTTRRIDFKGVLSGGKLNLLWPMELEGLVDLYPGNIAVIAGAPDAGKTAFLLSFINLNQGYLPIHYFCSEMGEMELRQRLNGFGKAITEWDFDAVERTDNFADVIYPNDINIIDFMELPDNVYMVGKYLTDITQKLDGGIALVAIQKKRGAKNLLGRGQEFSLEKPRLYLSMDSGIIRIVKGKHWVNYTRNPNGLERKFKIVRGCQFITMGDWEYGS